MADEKSDKPSGAQEPGPAGGKDVLFGWLVGRAAADLGLAEAIAASEAQRTEQIKRLEETLLGQIQELQRQRSGDGPATIPAAEMGELQAQIQSLTLRLGLLEESSHRAGNASKLEVGALTTQIVAQGTHLEQLASSFADQLRNLRQELTALSPSSEISGREISELQSAIRTFSERLIHIESAMTLTAAAERDAERARWSAEIDEHMTARIRDLGDEIREKLKAIASLKCDFEAGRAETAALGSQIAYVERDAKQAVVELKAELSAQQAAMSAEQQQRQPHEDAVKTLADELNKRVADLEASVRDQLQGADARRSEAATVQAQVLSLSQRVADLAGRSEKTAAQTAAHEQWAKDHEQSVESRLVAIANQLNEQQRSGENRGAEMASLRLELSGMVERLGRVEFTAHEAHTAALAETGRSERTANRMVAEIATLKAEVSERLQALKTPQVLLQDFERTIGLKFQELQRQLSESQKDGEGRDERIREIGRAMQTVAERLATAESVSQRTHALIVNESEQSAQIRQTVRADIDSLQAQLAKSPWSGAALEGIEEKISARIRELESEVGQKMRLIEFRDAEFHELKAEVQNLNQGLVRAVAPVALSPSPGVQSTSPSVVIPMDINALRARRDDHFSADSHAAENTPSVPAARFASDTRTSGDTNAGKDHMRLLQERISADIERARAELREKSGRWKARR